jgi:hypothetical protein
MSRDAVDVIQSSIVDIPPVESTSRASPPGKTISVRVGGAMEINYLGGGAEFMHVLGERVHQTPCVKKGSEGRGIVSAAAGVAAIHLCIERAVKVSSHVDRARRDTSGAPLAEYALAFASLDWSVHADKRDRFPSNSPAECQEVGVPPVFSQWREGSQTRLGM